MDMYQHPNDIIPMSYSRNPFSTSISEHYTKIIISNSIIMFKECNVQIEFGAMPVRLPMHQTLLGFEKFFNPDL